MRARFLLLAVLGLALAACRGKEAPAPVASATLAEAPVPSTLLAELSLGNPKETWQTLRRLAGNLAEALPSSVPVLFATSLSLPPAAAGNIDETVPMVGALLSRKDSTEPDFIVGVHVVSGAELVASLTLGDAAKFRRVEVSSRLVRLLTAPGAPELDGALGVSGNYLLLASSVDALRDAGRFVAESVSQRARREPGLLVTANQALLAGALSKRLRELWQARRAALSARDHAEREAKGRAPDFADPQVLLAGADSTIESWLGVLESSSALSLSFTPSADRLRNELFLTPEAEGAASLLSRELVVGSLAPLFQLPQGTSAGLLLRGDDRPSPDGLGDSVSKLLGERLSAAQALTLKKALDAFTRTRRGATTVGFVRIPAPALVIKCELADGAAFSSSFADLLALVELPPIGAWLSGTVGRPSLERSKLAETSHATLRFQRPQRPGSMLPAALSVTWQARDGFGTIVISADEKSGATLLTPPWIDTSSWLTRSSQEAFEQTALGLFVDARLFAPGGPDEAPILLSFGKKSDRIALTLDASAAALPALSRLFAVQR